MRASDLVLLLLPSSFVTRSFPLLPSHHVLLFVSFCYARRTPPIAFEHLSCWSDILFHYFRFVVVDKFCSTDLPVFPPSPSQEDLPLIPSSSHSLSCRRACRSSGWIQIDIECCRIFGKHTSEYPICPSHLPCCQIRKPHSRRFLFPHLHTDKKSYQLR